MSFDFGYTWPWTRGHLIAAVLLTLVAVVLWRVTWRRTAVLAGCLAVWAFAAAFIVEFVFGFNRPMTLPARTFLASGSDRVLDAGCGSGRATVMVGPARSQTELVGLDNFSAQYIKGNGEALFLKNADAAGIRNRVSVMEADMRHIPAADASFDAVVSTYAIDHLGRKGSQQALREVARVLRPNGEFLLAIIQSDARLNFVYSPLAMHGGFGSAGRWRQWLNEAGFDVIEQGSSPASAHFLCRRRG